MLNLKKLIGGAKENALTEVKNIRLHIEKLQSNKDELEDGRISKQDCLQRIDDWIVYHADRFEEHQAIGNLFLGSEVNNSSINLELYSKTQLFDDGNGGQVAMSADSKNNTAMMCFFFPQIIKEKFIQYIERLNIPEDCPPLSERPAIITDINSKIRALEVKEEALIVEAETYGIFISRHPNCSPEVVLEFQE